jgi:hypothetical protein
MSLIGFIFRLAARLVNEQWGNGVGLTDEMIARGQKQTL